MTVLRFRQPELCMLLLTFFFWERLEAVVTVANLHILKHYN